MKKTSNERTSETVASVAGRLLNGQSVKDATAWLEGLALRDSACDDNDRTQALALLGVLASMRTVAASALTQR